MTDFDNLINIFRKNHILVTNDRLNPHRENYLAINMKLSKIYYNYTKQFRTEKEAMYCLLHHVEPEDVPRCPMCGKLSKFVGKYYNITCGECNYNNWDVKKEKIRQSTTEESIRRGKEKSRKTCMERYGVPYANAYVTPELKAKHEKRWLELYGVKNTGQTKEAKLKRKATLMRNYGVDHNFKLFKGTDHSKRVWEEKHDEIVNKMQSTCLERYGVKSYTETDEFKQQAKKTMIQHYGSIEDAYKHKYEANKKTKLERYGDECYNNIDKIKSTLKSQHTKFETEHNCTQYIKLINEYGQGWQSLDLPIIKNRRFKYISNEYLDIIKEYSETNHNGNSVSRPEEEIFDYISTFYNKEVKRNIRGVIKDENHSYELDIYLPNIKVAIEFNGTYWHSNLFKDKYYHQTKTKLCKEKNIILIHIFEFDWIKDKNKCLENIKDIILNYKQYKKKLKDVKFSEPEIIFESKDKEYVIWNDGLENIIK